MSGKTVPFANELLKLLFNATNIANIADNASASTITRSVEAPHNAIR